MFLTCETSPATNPLSTYNLDVKLFVNNKQESLCAAGVSCKFSYSSGKNINNKILL